MKYAPSLIVFLGCLTAGVQAADELPQNCSQIRERIKAVTGPDISPSMDLLEQIALHQECNFSSAEVYRAAAGDKPLPSQERHEHRESGESDLD